MKLAISNIAWPAQDGERMLDMIRDAGVTGVEIAPTRLWPEPTLSGAVERGAFRRLLERRGLNVAAMHSLLWGRDDLGLFREPEVERRTQDFLCALARLAADLGAGVLVFGSPQGRRRGGRPLEQAFARAAEFFYVPARAAAEAGVSFVIEPLGAGESDFINTCDEAVRLVRMVDHPGFGLHVDAKALAEETDAAGRLERLVSGLRHFHINDPGLVEVGSVADYHPAFGAALRAGDYQGYASIEMKTMSDHRGAVARSLERSRRHYLAVEDTR